MIFPSIMIPRNVLKNIHRVFLACKFIVIKLDFFLSIDDDRQRWKFNFARKYFPIFRFSSHFVHLLSSFLSQLCDNFRSLIHEFLRVSAGATSSSTVSCLLPLCRLTPCHGTSSVVCRYALNMRVHMFPWLLAARFRTVGGNRRWCKSRRLLTTHDPFCHFSTVLLYHFQLISKIIAFTCKEIANNSLL